MALSLGALTYSCYLTYLEVAVSTPSAPGAWPPKASWLPWPPYPPCASLHLDLAPTTR